MTITSFERKSSVAEIVAEMDRRGAVIETLEAEIYRLRATQVAALSTAPPGDGVPGMVLDPATIEACAKVADEKGFAVADTNADRYWQSVRISRAIRALSASSGETKP